MKKKIEDLTLKEIHKICYFGKCDNCPLNSTNLKRRNLCKNIKDYLWFFSNEGLKKIEVEEENDIKRI